MKLFIYENTGKGKPAVIEGLSLMTNGQYPVAVVTGNPDDKVYGELVENEDLDGYYGVDDENSPFIRADLGDVEAYVAMEVPEGFTEVEKDPSNDYSAWEDVAASGKFDALRLDSESVARIAKKLEELRIVEHTTDPMQAIAAVFSAIGDREETYRFLAAIDGEADVPADPIEFVMSSEHESGAPVDEIPLSNDRHEIVEYRESIDISPLDRESKVALKEYINTALESMVATEIGKTFMSDPVRGRALGTIMESLRDLGDINWKEAGDILDADTETLMELL